MIQPIILIVCVCLIHNVFFFYTSRGGYYTVLVEKGFRIISLNMNYGNVGNWWLWINSTDPAGQLQWLADTLHKAEENHEKVFI